jgi:hypothetical protein
MYRTITIACHYLAYFRLYLRCVCCGRVVVVSVVVVVACVVVVVDLGVVGFGVVADRETNI